MFVELPFFVKYLAETFAVPYLGPPYNPWLQQGSGRGPAFILQEEHSLLTSLRITL